MPLAFISVSIMELLSQSILFCLVKATKQEVSDLSVCVLNLEFVSEKIKKRRKSTFLKITASKRFCCDAEL